MTSFRVAATVFLVLAGIQVTTLAGHLPTGEDSVTFIATSGLQAYISQHRGDVLVINVWATWCAPCVEEIPDLITLSKDEHVRVVGISIDDPEDVTSKVVPFLKKHAVSYPVFVKAAGKDEAFINALNRQWTGAVPVTFVYDGAGRQRTMLVGKQSYAALRKAVESSRAR
jgi:thiol-disulfide isomerase/thioredoxin